MKSGSKSTLRSAMSHYYWKKWILDVDTTVKPPYGHQEGAEICYNPSKPGRPAHVIHTYSMAETRLILDSEVLPGNQQAAVAMLNL